MSASVAELEADVARSRQELLACIEDLRSPQSIAYFKAELEHEKDELIRKASDATRDAAGRLVEDVKARALANPAAALSIGAGIAWYLLRHPPIASVLVGLGAIGLAKTPPTGTVDGVTGEAASQMKRAAEAAGAAIQQHGGRLVASSRVLIHDARDQASDIGARVAAQVAAQSAVAARQLSGQVNRSLETVRTMAADEESRDQALLGAAALSVLAAVGIAFTRRQQPR